MNPIRPYGAGFNIDEPAAFASKIFDLMGQVRLFYLIPVYMSLFI